MFLAGRMKKTKALFLVDTPHQVFNLLQAVTTYNIDIYDIVICDACRADAFEQLKKGLFELNARYTYVCQDKYGSIEDRIESYGRYINLLQSEDYTWVFFCNIRQIWQRDIVCSLPKSKVVLMDDGNSNVVFYKYMISKGVYFNFPPSNLPYSEQKNIDALRCRFGIRVDSPLNLEMFTVYDLKPNEFVSIKRNTLDNLCFRHEMVDEERVVFLGAGVVTVGCMEENQYIQLLQNSIKLFPNKKFVYIPHRIESEQLVENTCKQLGIEYMRLGQPIESWLKKHNKPPKFIVSLFSTALFHCSLCFPSLKVISVMTEDEIWEPAKNAHVWNVCGYDSYELITTFNQAVRDCSRIEKKYVSLI